MTVDLTGDPRIIDRRPSASWEGPAADLSVIVCTYGRAAMLSGLFAALAKQDVGADSFEVVIVDNGSTDDTWAVLCGLMETTPLRAAALRLGVNRGPAPGRNAAAAVARGSVLAITDDDCLPTPGWLRHLLLEFASGADVVQGAVHPDPAGVSSMGPWDHTKSIRRPTPFFETCNVAYRKAVFDAAGGFDEDDPLLHPPSGRAFGEDACLAWSVLRDGGTAAFAPQALVHHRCIPSDYRRWLADQRELAGFPGLADRSPLVAQWLHRGVFLDRRSEQFDLAVVAVVAAAVTRRRWPLLATAPWLRRRWRDARSRSGTGSTALVLARLAWSDAVALRAMASGSVRHGRVVL